VDNTALTSWVIDNREEGVFRINRRTLTDPQILELEKERVFGRCWIYAGHESEIPNPGNFCARNVAGRPVILVRGSDQQVRVLLNTCRHRGALVCRERAGNTKTFQCPYHAWTYNNRGELVGVPGEDAYSPAFDRQQFALATPPRMESYRGFLFISFDPAIEPGRLPGGRHRVYLDLASDQSAVGMEIVGGTQAYSMRANWKLLVENSIDGYHGIPTHQRFFTFLVDSGIDLREGPRIPGVAKALGNGHAVMEYDAPWGRPLARWVPAFGEAKKAEFAVLQKALEERFGLERAHRISQYNRNLLIFPNLIINDITAITVRTFFPVAADYMEINAWALAPKDETPENRALRLDNFLTFLGPGGFATPDDVDMLESCQRGFLNREVEWSDMSRGMKRDQPVPTDELQLRTFWRRWNQLITLSQPIRAVSQQAA